MLDLLHQILPEQSANFFRIRSARRVWRTARIADIRVMLTLWSGSTGVYALMEQLDVICDVTERRPFWERRGTAIFLTLFFALLAIGSLSFVILGGVLQLWLASDRLEPTITRLFRNTSLRDCFLRRCC